MPSQLKMKWRNTPFEIPAVPEGYKLHTYIRNKDEIFTAEEFKEEWFRMIVTGIGVGEDYKERYHEDPLIPDDGFFVVLDGENKIAATAGIQFGRHSDDSTTLHMVVTDPIHRGKQLGKIVTVAAMEYARTHGVKYMYLTTDDFRKAAVNMYLKLGFKPCLYEPDMHDRWVALFEELGTKDRTVLDENENEIVI